MGHSLTLPPLKVRNVDFFLNLTKFLILILFLKKKNLEKPQEKIPAKTFFKRESILNFLENIFFFFFEQPLFHLLLYVFALLSNVEIFDFFIQKYVFLGVSCGCGSFLFITAIFLRNVCSFFFYFETQK